MHWLCYVHHETSIFSELTTSPTWIYNTVVFLWACHPIEYWFPCFWLLPSPILVPYLSERMNLRCFLMGYQNVSQWVECFSSIHRNCGLIKPTMASHTCNPRALKLKAEESEIHGHSLLVKSSRLTWDKRDFVSKNKSTKVSLLIYKMNAETLWEFWTCCQNYQ